MYASRSVPIDVELLENVNKGIAFSDEHMDAQHDEEGGGAGGEAGTGTAGAPDLRQQQQQTQQAQPAHRPSRQSGAVVPASVPTTSTSDPTHPLSRESLSKVLHKSPDQDDSDDEGEDMGTHLKEPRVKDALTYGLGITIAHELFGTFMFIYSVLAVATRPEASRTDVAFTIAAAAFVYSHVFSKAHFNTWITIYLFLTDIMGRSFDAELIELYPERYRGATAIARDSKRAVRFMSLVHVVCQLIGSSLGAWFMYHFPLTSETNLALTNVGAGMVQSFGTGKSWLAVMFLEMMLTYALLYSLNLGDGHRPGRSKEVFFSVGPPIVLFLGIRTVGDFTGASFNFARSFGPALVTGNWGRGALGYYAIAQALATLCAIAVEHYRFKKHIRLRRKAIRVKAAIAEEYKSRMAAKAARRHTVHATMATTRTPE